MITLAILNGLFTLHGTGTIGHNGTWSMSMSQTSVNISALLERIGSVVIQGIDPLVL